MRKRKISTSQAYAYGLRKDDKLFRLVKILNSANIAEETTKLKKSDTSVSFIAGTAVTYNNGILAASESTEFPDYIVTKDATEQSNGMLLAYPVTENMIFKVDYTSVITPRVGLKVGISNHNGAGTGVLFNTGGKGVIVEVDKNKKNIVYVKFHKT